MISSVQKVPLVLVLCCVGAALVSSTLTVLPLNDAVLVGSTVELHCSVSSEASRVLWTEFASNSHGSVLRDKKYILPSHPSASRYSIVGGELDYNLQIRNVSLSDGGTYLCQDINSGPPNTFRGYAELIVLAGDPVCEDFVTGNGIVLEGKNYSSECEIRYKGNIAPIMEWSGPGNFVTNGSTTPEFVWSWKRFTADRSVDGEVFTCHTAFPQVVGDPGHADNTPAYEHTYNSAVLEVYRGPKDTFITPQRVEYSVGDILTCVSDAFPPPYYLWQNMRTLEVYPDITFTVLQDMLGFNQTMRCQAQNLIDGFLHTDNAFQAVYVPEVCVSSPCIHGTVCLNNMGGYKCDCDTGYTGTKCESEIPKPCLNSPCYHGTACFHESGDYTCNCDSGYTGLRCETPIKDDIYS